MNERIRELSYEAEDYADSIVDSGGEFHESYTEKLAELFVRECVTVLAKRLQGDMSEDMDVLYCITDLEKHFGFDKSINRE